MTIIDDARDWQQAIAQRDTLTQQVADLRNQIDTANLQHGNDQQAIADLQAALGRDDAKLTELYKQIADLNTSLIAGDNKVVRLNLELTALEVQLAQLQSTVTYPDLEWSPWSLNDSVVVGGSANGISFFTPADSGKSAVFSVFPNPVASGTNYYDVYGTQKKKPNAAYRNYSLFTKWDFPSDADMNAAHCIEMEARQVFGGMAAVPALQMNFTGNQLRYFDKAQGWVATGQPMPRARSISALLEAHRDDTTVYYDAFTINGTRYPLTVREAIFPLTWAERMSVSLQLDAKTVPFKVNPSGVTLKVW